MNKTLLSIILIIISIATFFVWINPHYADVKYLQTSLSDSTNALAQAQSLDAKRLSLVETENSFNPSDLAKLQKLLPDNVDNVRFIIDMQGIASHYGLTIQDIKSNGNSQSSTASTQAIGASNNQAGETTLSFSVTTTYESLVAFLKDVEKSLRIVEVRSLTFSADDTHPDLYKVSMTVGTFWLNQTSLTAVTPTT